MDARDTISRVLSQRYHPRAMIVYGSYARGDWDEESDFDCLLIADSKPCDHDGSLIEVVTLESNRAVCKVLPEFRQGVIMEGDDVYSQKLN